MTEEACPHYGGDLDCGARRGCSEREVQAEPGGRGAGGDCQFPAPDLESAHGGDAEAEVRAAVREAEEDVGLKPRRAIGVAIPEQR